MDNYLLKECIKKRTISSFDKDIFIDITSIFNKKKFCNVKNIRLYDNTYLNNYIYDMLSQKLGRLYSIVTDIIESDDATSSDAMMALDQIERFREEIEIKYEDALNKKSREYFLDEIIKIRTLMENRVYTVLAADEIYMENQEGRSGR